MAAPRRLTWRNLRRAAGTLSRIIWRVGIRGNYRREFWKMVWTQGRRRDLDMMFRVAIVSHHLITYARECTRGEVQSSNYSRRVLDDVAQSEADATFSAQSA